MFADFSIIQTILKLSFTKEIMKKIKKKKKKIESQKGREISAESGESERRGRIFFFFFLSKIYENWIVDFYESKR